MLTPLQNTGHRFTPRVEEKKPSPPAEPKVESVDENMAVNEGLGTPHEDRRLEAA